MKDKEEIAGRIRDLLADRGTVEEKRIVGGGQGFMVNGHLCCGLSKRGLTVRVGPEGKAKALSEPHVQPLRVGKKETTAFVVVALEALEGEGALESWVARGLRFVETLGPA